MTIELWAAFAMASALLLVIPGPTILTVISYSIAHGSRANVPLVAAVALGDCTALFLSTVGLGAVLATSALMFNAVKWAGGLYLIYLGIKLLRSNASPVVFDKVDFSDSWLTLFRNTWLVTALNPKGIIFFVAFLPQFINPSQAVALQLWILSVTFITLATINALFYSVFAARARNILSTPDAQRRFNLGGGALLTIAGVWALTVKHSA